MVALAFAALTAATCSHAATLRVDDLGDGSTGTGAPDDPYRDLQHAIAAAGDGDTLAIMPGTFEAVPESFTDQLCGNCERHETPVTATRGFHVSGKSLCLIGSGPAETTLVTNAGYGVFFEDSPRSTIARLTVTGGVRDADGMATDAGIVARLSRVAVNDVRIADNDDRHDDVVVGIGGVMGREGAELLVAGCVIDNNGWDGVALYRGATAYLADNTISRGRGAGVGITWDASAVVLRNRISGYWKGIGSFGGSTVVVRNNEVFDNLGWGLVATGTSSMEASNNVVARNGNCGVALWSDEATLALSGNIITGNGWRDEWVCPRVGVWLNGDERNLDARFNNVWGNVEGDYRDVDDLTGSNGNVSLDPQFADSLDFSLLPGSPCLGAADPAGLDSDGGPADMGSGGGPDALRGAEIP
ncbi:MAG: right-handed parallel beta-helix repeat-containing protein [Candidatus Eisenbacteria bacterium]